ncbi:RNA-binding protein 28 [Phyllopteryx taeniolatus]|uniref:RNA-binding protein 28 n=1 Tax=Phyllopteryx taeniolatus TaxID=161469 RepID=UPI002AD2A60A|nr:RNA-binding protein 28 [Phyllopteryx taeniolatus]
MPAQTLFVGSLPASASNERLGEIFSEVGPVKQCFVVREKGAEKCRGFGYVTYAMEEDAQRALKDIKEYDGKKLSISVAKKKLKDKKKSEPDAAAVQAVPPPSKETEQKVKNIRKNTLKARLIIRNLSFKCSEKELMEVFGKFGEVLEAKIPLKPDGKMRGFAFVQFKTMSGAAKGLQTMNLKEIKGRQVAVDWAVPKDKYVAMQETSTTETTTSDDAAVKKSDPQSDGEDEDEEESQVADKVSPNKCGPPEKELLSDDDDDDDDDEEEDSDEEEDENDVSQEGENDDASLDTATEDEYDEDEDDDEEEEEDVDGDQSAQKKSKKTLPSDVKEGRTIFIRNLSFDTEEEGLEETLLQYGELKYVKILIHSDTGHSKGCAFAQFKAKEAADRCIAAAQDEAEADGIRVDGRKLLIVAAVSRDDAAKLKVNKVKVQTGSRNLYLAREGLIRAGSKAAESVPEADMIKRARFEEIKRAKLRDVSIFVSKNRLCVHNLPKSLDSAKLRALCLRGLGGVKSIRMPECRIMYDRKPEKGQVMGQSLGYGFVQFTAHEHALATLRYLNNNPDIFGGHKRPIVEFSLEDSRKLKIKEMRRQKSKEHNLKQQGGKDNVMPQKSRDWKETNRAPHAKQRPSKHCGFQTKPEVEHVDLENGKKRRKVLAFPSHRGPKIRMRDKGKQKAPPPKKAQRGGSKRDWQTRKMEKPTETRNQNAKGATRHSRNRDGDRFDSLVEQYKKKLLSRSEKSSIMRKSKWFDN